MADISKSGVWFDSKARKVVKSQPEEGIQLAAPGTEITPDVQASIDQYEGIDEQATAPAVVETATVKPSARK